MGNEFLEIDSVKLFVAEFVDQRIIYLESIT